MERDDFGLIVQLAATGSFDFTAVGPAYHTRLALVLRGLFRNNLAKSAACAALHCAVTMTTVSDEDYRKAWNNMTHNHNLMREMLNLPVKDEKTNRDRLVAKYREVQKKLQGGGE